MTASSARMPFPDSESASILSQNPSIRLPLLNDTSHIFTASMTLFTKSSFFNTGSQLQNSINGATPAKSVAQKFLKRLASRFRGNDNPGLLQWGPLVIL